MDNSCIKVSVYYKDGEKSIVDILKQSLWFYIVEEVKRLCERS